MNLLGAEHWHKFKRTNGSFDGAMFEELIGNLLHLHTNSKWEPTKKSWDGSKDFVLEKDNTVKWAECKAYSEHISLKVIAPTLVMATVDHVDHIYFFSYSKLTPATRIKLCAFGAQTNKTIIIIDDEILEQLILKYIHVTVIKTSFPKFNKGDDENQTNISLGVQDNIKVDCKLSKDPDIFSNIENAATIDNDFEVNLFSTFVLDVFIQNNSLMSEKEVSIHFDINKLSDSNLIFLSQDAHNGKLESYFCIPPLCTVMKRFYLKSISNSNPFNLDIVSVKYDGTSLKLKLPKIKITSIGTAVELVGERVNNFITNECKALNHRDKTTFVCIYGESGTGKTRLIEEICNKLYLFGFDVHEFDGENSGNSSFNYFIRNLYAKLSYLPFDESFIADDNELTEVQRRTLSYRLIYNHKEIDFIKELDSLIEYVHGVLRKKRISLIIDNVQHFDDNAIKFLTLLKEKCSNNEGHGNITLCFNKTFMIKGSKADILMNSCLAESSDQVISFEVLGFSENDVRNYIGQLLVSRSVNNKKGNDLLDTINLIIERSSKISDHNGKSSQYYSPLYLVQMLLMLEQNNVLYRNTTIGYYFIDPNQLYEELKNMPRTLEGLLDKRWTHLLDNYEGRKGLENIISVLSFMIHVKENHLLGYFADNANEIEQLKHSGIISSDILNNLVFYHRKLYEFFRNKYSSFYKECSQNIIDLIKYSGQESSDYFYQYFIIMQMDSEKSEKKKIDKDLLSKACASVSSGSVFNESYLSFLPSIYKELYGFERNDERINLKYRIETLVQVCEETSSKIGFTKAQNNYSELFNNLKYNESKLKHHGLEISKMLMNIANSYLPLYKDAEGIEVLKWGVKEIESFSFYDIKSKKLGLGNILNRLCVFYKSLDNPEEARDTGLKALNIARECKDKFLELKCLIDLGNTYEGKIKDDSDSKSLLFYWEESIRIYMNEKDCNNDIANSRPMVMLYKLQVLLLKYKYDEFKKLSANEVKYCYDHQNYFFMMKMQILQVIAEMVINGKPDYTSLLKEAKRINDVCLTYNANRSYWNTFYLLAKISLYNNDIDEMETYYRVAFDTLVKTAGEAKIISYNDDLIHEMIIDYRLNNIDYDFTYLINKLPDYNRKQYIALSKMSLVELKQYLKSKDASWSTFTKDNRNLPTP